WPRRHRRVGPQRRDKPESDPSKVRSSLPASFPRMGNDADQEARPSRPIVRWGRPDTTRLRPLSSRRITKMRRSVTVLLTTSLAGLMLGVATPARAQFSLGLAANYGAIAGPNTTKMNLNNSTYNGNVATDNPTTTAG